MAVIGFAIMFLCFAFHGYFKFQVRRRLRKAGVELSILQTPVREYRSYRDYLRIAPQHGWSHWPVTLAILFLILTMAFGFGTISMLPKVHYYPK